MTTAASLLNTSLLAIDSRISTAIGKFVLSPADLSGLRTASVADGRAALSGACITLSEAMGALDRRSFSWACVKFYYAAYYAVRAWLAYSDEIHIYVDRKPWYLVLRPGETIRRGAGNSHEYAFDRFASRFETNPILSQDVQAEGVFDWLRHRRESVQYLRTAFIDPECHELFAEWDTRGGRSLLEHYLGVDSSSAEFSTLFDERHAMAAIPLRLFADLLATVRAQHGYALDSGQLAHCGRLCRIGGNPVARWNRLLSGA